jgi:hypothetical protein
MLSYVFDPIFDVLSNLGVDVEPAIEAAESILTYIITGWQMLNIFCPTLDACLGLAMICVSIEVLYVAYLGIMWILKKIPMLGVS